MGEIFATKAMILIILGRDIEIIITMRRSLGTKPGVLPPKRVRSSQESAGLSVLPSITGPRQSRSSNTGMSSGKRGSSVSRSVPFLFSPFSHLLLIHIIKSYFS